MPVKEKNNPGLSIWNRRFILALMGHFFVFMTIGLFFLFPLFLKQLQASESRIGFIMGMNSVVIIFVRPLVGTLIDKKGRKAVSLVGVGILILVFPFFLLIQDAGWLPVVLRALTGLGWGVGMTAIVTMCSDLAPAGRLGHSMGIIGIAGILSHALGPWLGEELIRNSGFSGLFIGCEVMAVLAFICMLLTPEVKRSGNDSDLSGWQVLKRLSVPLVIIICFIPMVHGAVRGSVVYFISLFIKSLQIERVGPFFVAFSLAAILTRLGIGGISDRYGRKRVIFPAVMIICINLFLISTIKSPLLVMVTGFIGGFGQGLLFPALSTYLIDILGHNHKGFAISLYLTLFDIGIGFGSPFFGTISQRYGFRTMYIVAALIFITVTIIFTLKAPEKRKNF